MTAADRDLVAALRGELAAIDPSRPCDREAERVGLGAGGRSWDPVVARLAVRLARRGRTDPVPEPATPAGAGAKRAVGTRPEPAAAGLSAVAGFDWDGRPEHCRMAWLRGIFLDRGSLSVANGRTHLEFVVTPVEAPILAARLGAAGMPASWRIRRRHGVVTWKSGMIVGTFLRRIGASPTLLEIEARQVSRTLRGELNRIINAESSNVRRSVAAAGRQLMAIESLEARGRLGEQPGVVRMVAAARREMPDATLSDLASRLAVHRSAVQRALDRLERVAVSEDEARPLA
ncbi:MAG TPA: DNA-binding protein WhiA [Candidatus Eisenbacteria bacterium]|nr:DNA-binding protein WhiA [Candidatus Eisenbacteria bacterium]